MDWLLHFIIAFFILYFTRSWPLVAFCILGKEFYDLEIMGGNDYFDSMFDIIFGIAGAIIAALFLDTRRK